MTTIAARLEAQYPAPTPASCTDVVTAAGTARRRHAATLYTLLGAVGAGAAHRLRQRREPAARARDVARTARWSCAPRSARRAAGWSGSCSPRAPCSGLPRRCSARGSRGSACSALVALAPANLPRLDEIRVDDAALAVRGRRRARRERALRSRPRAAGVARAARRRAAAGRQGVVDRRARRLGAERVRRRRDRPRRRAGRRRRAARAQSRGAVGGGHGLPARAPAGAEHDRARADLDEAPRATAFYRDLLPELRAMPGVTAVGGVTGLPTAVRVQRRLLARRRARPSSRSASRAPQAVFTVVTPDYFRTMGVPLQGAAATSPTAIGASAPFVAIINESLARASFPGQGSDRPADPVRPRRRSTS